MSLDASRSWVADQGALMAVSGRDPNSYIRVSALLDELASFRRLHGCTRCGHPRGWHRLDDSTDVSPADPDAQFRCIGYDCESSGPVPDGGRACDCPDYSSEVSPAAPVSPQPLCWRCGQPITSGLQVCVAENESTMPVVCAPAAAPVSPADQSKALTPPTKIITNQAQKLKLIHRTVNDNGWFVQDCNFPDMQYNFRDSDYGRLWVDVPTALTAVFPKAET